MVFREVVKVLLKSAHINYKDAFGYSSLMHASIK